MPMGRVVKVHGELQLPKGGMEVPEKGNKRSPRCLGSPRKVMEVLEKKGGGPQGAEVWTGVGQVPEALRAPKGGMEMEKESDGSPQGLQE